MKGRILLEWMEMKTDTDVDEMLHLKTSYLALTFPTLLSFKSQGGQVV